MTPVKSKARPALEEEIVSLETEMRRVAALSTTSDTDRAALAVRLQRLKKIAGMPLK